MWKIMVQRGRPQMAIWRMRIACWIPKATNAYVEYVILIAFLRGTLIARKRLDAYIACFVRKWKKKITYNHHIALYKFNYDEFLEKKCSFVGKWFV
jgi:hypothetical protein